MAAVIYSLVTPSGGVATAAAGTNLTVLQVSAPTNQQVKISHFSVYFRGVAPTDPPIQVRVMRQTKATGTSGGSVTPTSINNSAQAIQSTGAYGYTAEPTYGAVLFEDFIQPQLGSGISNRFGEEWICLGGGSIGIVVLLSGGAANYANATLICEE